MKPIDFHPRVLEFIRGQTVPIRRQIGEALRDLQKGISPGMPLSRPMSVIAPGVRELRVSDETTTVRGFYSTANTEALAVLHAFQKKSQKRAVREIELARRRLREVLNEKIEF